MLFVFIYLFTYLFSVKNGKIVAGKPQPLVTNSPKFPTKLKIVMHKKGRDFYLLVETENGSI